MAWFITWLLLNVCVNFVGVNILPLLFYRNTIVYINHMGEAMDISLIDFQWTSTET